MSFKLNNLDLDTICPCGSGLQYVACCEVYHLDIQVPLTAEALMRSRYSAFAKQNTSYLQATWDVTTRPATLDLTDDPSRWQKLELIKTQQGTANDTEGYVEFKAYGTVDHQPFVLHERSHFVKRQQRWFYVDGIIKANAKLSQNAPCACGSGKKYKRCCGQA